MDNPVSVVSDVLIMVPTEREAACFAAEGLVPHICGVGMAECGAAVARLLAGALLAGRLPQLVVLAGVAGTYTDRLALGAAVVVTHETVADLGRRESDGSFTPLFQKTYAATALPAESSASLPVVRSNTVNLAGWEPALTAACTTPHTRAGAAALPLAAPPAGAFTAPPVVAAEVENMEGAAFFAVCERFGVPAMEIRTISNRVGEHISAAGLDLAVRSLAPAVKKALSDRV